MSSAEGAVRIGLYIAGGVLIVCLLLLGLHGLGFRFDPFNSAGKAKAQAAAAQTQTKTVEAAVPIIERYHDTQVRIITQAERSAADVHRLPTSETPLDPAFAAGLRRMLDNNDSAPVDGSRQP